MTDLLEHQLASTVNPLDDSDWPAVRRRARPRRRPLVAAAAAVVALAAVVPAFGLGGKLVDLIEGPPAPAPVKTFFASNDALRRQLFAGEGGATKRMRQQYSPVISEQARGIAAIESPDGPIFLWAAPTEAGGQCWLIQAGGDTGTGRPYGAGSCDDADTASPLATDTFWTAERPNVQIVHARVSDDSIVRVDVELDARKPLSLPVASGHAIGTVPMNARVQALVGRDADSKEVARSTP